MAGKRPTKKVVKPAEETAAPPAKMSVADIRSKAIDHLRSKLEAGTIVGIELKLLMEMVKEAEDAELLSAATPSVDKLPFDASDLPFSADDLPFPGSEEGD